ncbi:MAG TPA: ABC transporter permease [Ilumatobacter sp.]|nr:ABC transporter permease [Ilumatobacter sp.]
MISLLVRRAASVVPILVLLSILVFGLVWATPGDPAVALAGGPQASPALVAEIRESLGLNDPVPTQYGRWLGRAVQGDLGTSLFTKQPVTSAILDRAPVTFSVTGLAFVFAMIIAVPAGFVAATRRGKWQDSLATGVASLGLATPSFLLGLVLVLVFALRLDWFPATGYTKPSEGVFEWLRGLVLPALTLGALLAAESMRQLRAALCEVLEQDFIRTARAAGLRQRAVLFRHASRNAAGPVVTVMGLQAAYLLGGSIIVERLFFLPGLGSMAVEAVFNRDIPVLQGIVLFAGVLVVLVNLAVDLICAWLNPKLRAV